LKKITTSCPTEKALHFIGGKWKLCIIQRLSLRTFRFNELKRTIPDISQKVLTQELRRLEQGEFISRKSYSGNALKVEYSLTDHGISLLKIVDELNSWAQTHDQHISKLVKNFNESI
jgi:DNA-binding HxlR family transcriptional regulator|tara:strand:+ start:2264 stop:2614 length:351 start_codon:yes stop_codon:yes gene_type:complete